MSSSSQLPPSLSLASACADHVLRFFDNKGELTQMVAHDSRVTCLAVRTPACDRIASGNRHGTVIISGRSGEHHHTLLVGDNEVLSIAWLTSGDKVLVAANDNLVDCYDVSSGNKVATLVGHETDCVVACVAVAPSGQLCATGASDGKLVLYSVNDFAPLCAHKHDDRVTCAAFFPDSTTLVTGSWDNCAHVLTIVSTGDGGIALKEIHSLPHDDEVNAVAVADDGLTIATACIDIGSVFVWGAQSGTKLRELDAHCGAVRGVAFFGKLLACGAENTVRVFDVSDGKEVVALGGHKSYCTAVAFLPAPGAVAPASSSSAAAAQINSNSASAAECTQCAILRAENKQMKQQYEKELAKKDAEIEELKAEVAALSSKVQQQAGAAVPVEFTGRGDGVVIGNSATGVEVPVAAPAEFIGHSDQ